MENLEILVVEDNPKHLADAKAEMQRRIDAGVAINVDFATNLAEAQRYLEEKKYDGIVSDVFFPTGLEKTNFDEDERIVEEVYQTLVKLVPEPRPNDSQRYVDAYWEMKDAMALWKTMNTPAPLAVYLAENNKQNVPIVFCTSTYHHGKKTEPVTKYAREKKVPLIDNDSVKEGEAEAKNWSDAYQILVVKIVGKQLELKSIDDAIENGKVKASVHQRFKELIGPYTLPDDKKVSDTFEFERVIYQRFGY